MALTWTNWNNGDNLLLLRNNLNTFNNNIVTENSSIVNSISNNTINIANNTANILTNTANILTNTNAISAINQPKDVVDFNELADSPVDSEGNVFYSKEYKSMAFQSDIPNMNIHTGIDSLIRIINKTGVLIPKGMPLYNGGVDTASNVVMAVPAQADQLLTSFVIGFSGEDIAINAEGWAINQGYISGIDTSGLTAGLPLFLSPTVAGGVVQVLPPITSSLGTPTIIDAVNGEMFIIIDNLIAYPQATGYLRGQNVPAYSVTTTAQDIVNYTQVAEAIIDADELLGTLTVPIDGIYHISFTAVISFASVAATRTLYFELYNETTTTIEGAFPANIPRDATEEGVSFTAPFTAIIGHSYKIRVRGNTAIAVNLDNAAFMMTSNKLG